MRISICIPQYNRCAHLKACIDSLRAQSYRDLEVVVSDDGSTDGSQIEIPKYLERSGLRYQYIQQPRNLGYDANLRASLAAGSGDYLFILGNDDALPESDTLAKVAPLLDQFRPDLAIGNFCDAPTKTAARRVIRTRCVDGTPQVALNMFRALSCVTGLIFSRESFHRFNTDQYDGSIYVQMFLGSRIIASGGRLLTMDMVTAATGTDVGHGHANSYVDVLWKFRRTISPTTGGLDEVGRVVCEALWPYVADSDRLRVTTAVFSQLLLYSYSYWLYDYRSHDEPWAAFNLALGCIPTRLLKNTDPRIRAALVLSPSYIGATAGLVIPLGVLGLLKGAARNFAMRSR